MIVSVLGAGLLLLGGCTLSSQQPSAAHQQANKALLAPNVGPAGDLDIFRALESVKQQCMRAKGFTYYTEDVGLANFAKKGDPTDPLDIDTATLRATGYGLYAATGTGLNGTNAIGVSGSDAEESYVVGLPQAQGQVYGVALNGDDSSMIHLTLPDGKKLDNQAGGCDGQAYQRLYGQTAQYPGMSYYLEVFTYSYDIYDDVWNAAEAAGPYVAAESKWTACMRTAGYTYKTRGDVYADLQARYRAPNADRAALRPIELAVATADAGCVRTAGLNSVGEGQIALAAGNLSDSATAALRAWDDMDAQAAAVARQLLGAG
ncbi:MAG TPA: hypothetical protein VG756_31120 [Pseudonocardiaceae bacterium]|nr:hypothetical protein [Pseudonocardiaceae bacterium]